MIIDVHKYLIIGTKGEIDRFFSLAQRAGFLEFIGLSQKQRQLLPPAAQTLTAALKVLRRYPSEAPTSDDTLLTDPMQIAECILRKAEDVEKMYEEERLLLVEKSRIAIFGDFSLEDVRWLQKEGRRCLQFFCMKSALAKERILPPEMIYVGTEYDLDYFVAIQMEKQAYPGMIEIEISRPIGELRRVLRDLRLRIAHVERRLRLYAHFTQRLRAGLVDALNEYHLNIAKSDILFPLGEEQPLFAVEAWVPTTRRASLLGLISQLQVDCHEIAIEATDAVPTYMENRNLPKVGEDLVLLYDTPSRHDLDPSGWVLTFFALFFAMIVSDAAYGLMYLTLGLYLRWKFPHVQGMKQRLIRLVMILGASCMVWGVLMLSFLGLEIGPDHPYRKFTLLQTLIVRKADYHLAEKDAVYQFYVERFPVMQEVHTGAQWIREVTEIREGKVIYPARAQFADNVFLEFSLVVGIVHIALALCRSLMRHAAGLGWIAFLIGGYLYFPSVVDATTWINVFGWMSKATAEWLGFWMVLGGMGLATLLAFLQKGVLSALFELVHVTQIFADVLSYLRIYALALAALILAETANMLGVEFGWIAGSLVILAGHSMNLVLSTMGGVIHGLRLNFLEWYHYGFEGEGRLFNPLRRVRVEE